MLTRATGRLLALIVPALVILVVLAVPAGARAEGVQEKNEVAAVEEKEEGNKATPADEADLEETKAAQIAADAFAAEERSTFGGFRAYGDLQIAYRSVDLDGSDGRFRKDYGLDDGVRVLNSRVTFVPAGADPASWFDRIELFADGLGGDKYETWGIRANKTRSYRFSFRTREVDYFWNVTGDPHSWDLTRRNSDADLTVNLTEKLELTGTYRGFRQADARQTTRLISGDVFPFDEPLDQSGSTWGGGLRWRSGTTLLFASQDFHSFTDNGGFGTRGLNTGVGASEAFLSFLEQREIREMKAPTTRGGFQTQIAGHVWLSGDILYSKQELDFTFRSSAESNDFRDRPVQLEADALGEVNREILHGNVRAVWRPGDRLSLSGEYRRRSWDQSGTRDGTSAETFTTDDITRTQSDITDSAYEVTIDQFVFGAEWAVIDSGALFGEIGTGTRKQTFGTDGFTDIDSQTDATSYKVGGRFRSGRVFDAEASYERGDIDNPFTRLAPGTADSINVKLRARPGTGWQISGTYRLWDTENDSGDPKLDSTDPVQLRTENWGLNVAYGGTGERGRWAYAGYTRLKYDSNVPIRFVGVDFGDYQEGIAEYASTDDIYSVGGEYRLSVSSPLTLYGRLSYVNSDGTVPLTYYDTEIGIRYLLEMGVFLDAQGRFVKYADDTELPSTVDDYTGTILTLGLGYRF